MLINDYLVEPEKLARGLALFVDKAGIDEKSDKVWTTTIKCGLREIVERPGIEVLFTDSCNGVSEFIIDFIAWNHVGGEGIVLAAESEWIGVMRTSKSYAEEVAFDFWKLLCIKSPIKLMIFASSEKSFPHEPIIEELRKAFVLYQDHTPGELYIFMDFAPGKYRKAFYVRVPLVGSADFIQEPIVLNLA